jgi:hypothetical protein
MEHWWNLVTRENQITQKETCLSATLSNINPTWTGLESNTGLHSKRPATNCLSHGITVAKQELLLFGVQMSSTALCHG